MSPDFALRARVAAARVGLLIHFTAPTVHPGFSGTFTLEMINLGPTSILLRPGMPIAQLDRGRGERHSPAQPEPVPRAGQPGGNSDLAVIARGRKDRPDSGLGLAGTREHRCFAQVVCLIIPLKLPHARFRSARGG